VVVPEQESLRETGDDYGDRDDQVEFAPVAVLLPVWADLSDCGGGRSSCCCTTMTRTKELL